MSDAGVRMLCNDLLLHEPAPIVAKILKSPPPFHHMVMRTVAPSTKEKPMKGALIEALIGILVSFAVAVGVMYSLNLWPKTLSQYVFLAFAMIIFSGASEILGYLRRRQRDDILRSVFGEDGDDED
jgi:hypothetical protein